MIFAENKYDISVIIPAYNVGERLRITVESVLKQKGCSVQMILVDDGSSDNTSQICEDYEKKYSFVQVLHQANQGLSMARNNGLSLAEGEYVFFLDGDDTLSETTFAVFADFIKGSPAKPDVVITRAEKVEFSTGNMFPIDKRFCPEALNGRNGCEALGYILTLDHGYEWYVWKNFYRRAYLLEKDFRFMPGVVYEDVEWTPRVIAGAQTVGYIDHVSVNYLFHNPTSILNTPALHKSQDKIRISVRMCQWAQELEPALRTALQSNFSKLYVSAFGDYVNGSKALYPMLKEHKEVLAYTDEPFGRFVKKMSNTFGFSVGSRLVRWSVRLRRLIHK